MMPIKREKISKEYIEFDMMCKNADVEFNEKGFSVVTETDIINIIKQVKNNVVLADVSNRRKLLIDFLSNKPMVNYHSLNDVGIETYVDIFLKSIYSC